MQITPIIFQRLNMDKIISDDNRKLKNGKLFIALVTGRF